MWISKKKLEDTKRTIEHEAFLKSLKDDAELAQWKNIQQLKRDVKKLKKIIRGGY